MNKGDYILVNGKNMIKTTLQWRGRFPFWFLYKFGNDVNDYFYLICRKRRLKVDEILYIGRTMKTAKVRVLDHKHYPLDKIIEHDIHYDLIKELIDILIERYPGLGILYDSKLLEEVRLRRIVFFLGCFKKSNNQQIITDNLINGIECALIFHHRNFRNQCKRNDSCTKSFNEKRYGHLIINNENFRYYLRNKKRHPLDIRIDTSNFKRY